MKIDFEEWYNNRKFPKEAIELFNEGVQCYRIGAYRATFLMTYLGVEWILKEKILKGPIDSKYLNEDILRNLNDPDEWERSMSKIIIDTKKFGNPFQLKNDILDQFKSWRHLRNACAHAKSNKINYSVIEHFWFFIMNNIGKFELGGDRDSKIERLKNCYEYRNNLYATDLENIEVVVEDLITIEDDKIDKLLIQIEEIINIKDIKSDNSNIVYKCWHKIVNTSNETLRNEFIKFIKIYPNRFIYFVDTYPQIFTEIRNDYEFMTKFWKKEIIDLIIHFQYTKWDVAPWTILVRMLKESVIPKEEQDDFMEIVISKCDITNDEIGDILRETTYFEKVEKNLKSNNTDFGFSFDFVNKYASSIVAYLKYYEGDKKLIKSIYYKYTDSSYGEFHNKISGCEKIYKKFEEVKED